MNSDGSPRHRVMLTVGGCDGVGVGDWNESRDEKEGYG
jgi:hypothetical protein